MTDKPLDCIGLEMGAKVGKCEFRPYDSVTSNVAANSPEFSIAALTKAMDMLKTVPPVDEQIDHYRVGKDYLKMLERISTKVEEKPVYGGGGMLGILGGTGIILDEELPPDVCEFRNKDGKVLAKLRLEP